MDNVADARDIWIVGDPARARDTVAAALVGQGFAVTWHDDWNGVAAKGSKTRQMFLGALAQHFEVAFTVLSVDGGSIVRLIRPSAGFSAGVIGRQRAINQFNALGEAMTATFAANGVLRQS